MHMISHSSSEVISLVETWMGETLEGVHVIRKDADVIVFGATSFNQDLFIIKAFQLPRASEKYNMDCKAAREWDHKNIETYRDSFEVESFGVLIIGGAKYNLRTLINEYETVPPSLAQSIFYQVVSAVDYLHQKNISHLALKPECVLIQETGRAKIYDFEYHTEQNNRHEHISESLCSPPEHADSGDPQKCDMWALGVLLHVLLTSTWPFSIDTEHNLPIITSIDLTTLSQSFPDLLPLVDSLLELDPSFRPTTTTLLNNRWVADGAKQRGKSIEELVGGPRETSATSKSAEIQIPSLKVRKVDSARSPSPRSKKLKWFQAFRTKTVL